jgi:hypothetical protein
MGQKTDVTIVCVWSKVMPCYLGEGAQGRYLLRHVACHRETKGRRGPCLHTSQMMALMAQLWDTSRWTENPGTR